jgi:hypothetical protein
MSSSSESLSLVEDTSFAFSNASVALFDPLDAGEPGFASEVINRLRGDAETLSSSESLSRDARRALILEFGVNGAGDDLPDAFTGEDSRDEAIDNKCVDFRLGELWGFRNKY